MTTMVREPRSLAIIFICALGLGLLLLVAAAIGWPAMLARQPIAIGLGAALVVLSFVVSRARALRALAAEAAARARAQDAERRVRESEQLVRRLVEGAPDAMIVHDDTGRIVDVNAAACESLGYTRAELLQMDITDVEQVPDSARGVRRWDALQTNARITVNAVHRRKNGTTFRVEARLSVLHDDPPRIVVLARDVTEREHLELQLRQSQKMQAIGRLAGGVAHDFNNLLTAIRGHTELLLRDEVLGESGHTELIEIMKAAERAAALTRQLLAFTRQQVFKPEIVDLNATIGEMERMLRRLIGEDIELSTQLRATGSVRADRVQLEQVLLNLVVNARAAMPGGGALTIETADQTVSEREAAAYPWFRSGEYVVVTVRDTGIGMTADTLARVFEPFFTTKEKGQGTGLGLSTAYGIVKQSDGFIFVDSVPGRGTTFRVLLPRLRAQPAAPPPAPVPHAARENAAGAETVLVAEDEEAVRLLICRVLGRQGYNVLSARDGVEALRMAQDSPTPPDLLLTDIVMPRLGGPELARRLRREMPALRVVLMSGYTDDAHVLHGAMDEDVSFIGKPFAPDDLMRLVRATLDT
jgi:PAS domain S-box-containing protein